MKKFGLSVVAVLSMSALAFAGGDIAPVEPEVVIPAPAPAPVMVDESGPYLGAGISYLKTDFDHVMRDEEDEDLEFISALDAKTPGYMLQAGYKFNEYIAVEGRYWGSQTDSIAGYAVIDPEWEDILINAHGTAKVTSMGIFVKPMFPVTEKLSLYGLAGYGQTKATIKSYITDAKIKDEGFQYGGGISYAATENVSIFLDYVKHNKAKDNYEDYAPWDDEYTISYWEVDPYSINLGVTYKF